MSAVDVPFRTSSPKPPSMIAANAIELPKAVNALKQMKRAKFDETVEIHMALGIDTTQSEQMIRGSVSLPHGIGKSVRLVVFCQGDNVAKAKEAGADHAGSDELIEKIQKENWLDFDVALATQDLMGKVSRLGKVLGPRGLMPTPKSGTVVPATADIAAAFVRLIEHTETPILRTAPAPLMILSDLVRRSNFKVVLTGEGADEVFAGYDLFKEARIRRFWARQPRSEARPQLLSRLYPYLKHSPTSSALSQSFFAQGLEDTANPFYAHTQRWATTPVLAIASGKSAKSCSIVEAGFSQASAELRGRSLFST